MTPAEHLEAALAQLADLGLDRGRWRVELHVQDGRVRKLVPVAAPAPGARVAIGRKDLELACARA